MTDLGNQEATNMGNDFLLVLAVYYTDVFDGRCSGFQVTTLGIARVRRFGNDQEVASIWPGWFFL